MQPIKMIRGVSNKFYFVETHKSNAYDVLFELHVFVTPNSDGNCWSKKWEWTKKPILELNAGRIIALEYDT